MKPAESYQVELPVYQGPLELLLELIERAELDITSVALAQVTDQYLGYLERIGEHSLEDLAAFLIIAARLLQIKSEALLPRPPEREEGEEDPGEALARQLITYRKFKNIANHLAQRQKAGMRTYTRMAPAPLPEPKLDLEGIDLEDLRRAMLEVLRADVARTPLGRVVARHRVSVRDRIGAILGLIRSGGRTTFREVLSSVRSRLEIVVSFLAVLELIKLGRVNARQEKLFGDIELSPGEDWRQDQETDLDLEFE